LTSTASVLLVGGPDSGKSNYVGRVWLALKERKGSLERAGMPTDLEYVDSICAHLLTGKFAGRTDRSMERQEFRIPISVGSSGEVAELVVPDFTGELWSDAVLTSELPPDWLESLSSATGALLFVRVHSSLNTQPLDWVTARGVLELVEDNEDQRPPTQVILCELLRLLKDRLSSQPDGRKPRVAVIVSAWDLLESELRSAGPMAYLRQQFPLFAGTIDDIEGVDIRVFGVSVVGGDLERDPDFKARYHRMDASSTGSVTIEEDGKVKNDSDVTIPIAWAIGG
jgi:hypothetical protein